MNQRSCFINLVRRGINHRAEDLFQDIDWFDIQTLANKQGLGALVVDGIERLPKSQRPPKELLLQWIGDVLQSYEYRFELYRQAIAELSAFYRERGIKMMVLKGYACNIDWPKPEHRPCGDIDIWLFGEQKRGDELLASENGIKVDYSHHHHTVFNWRDFMVENHYDFVNVYDYKSSAELEEIFKKLGEKDTRFVNIYNEKVYFPSFNLHALFLIRHLVSHFCSTSITLRQILDWAFFVENHTKEIDWDWLISVIEEYHMKEFFNLINAICVDDLGFSSSIFPTVQYLPEMKERILEDIYNPAYGAEEPKHFMPRMVYKYKRWQGNAWKQKLCYSESRWESFWGGLWAHILKPSCLLHSAN